MSTTTAKSTRVAYGFPLVFPKTFTMSGLSKRMANKVKYITLYMRVKNALKDGSLIVAGSKTPTHVRRGRKELVFRRVDAKVASLSVTV